jgi:S-adenosyl-L-methionine hydrolase (adenosine-forming)
MLITLSSDFGYQDSFVGIMKGVIAGINPQARVIDLNHGIPAQDILAGALNLRHALSYFPRGTIHVAVVDPGVGSARQPLAIESGDNYFIGPDNGLLSLSIGIPFRAVALTNPAFHLQPASTTFHGRDIFAPVAAHLSLGVPLDELGPRIDDYRRLQFPEVSRAADRIVGQIVYIDGFGNLFTNIREHDLTGSAGDPLELTVGTTRLNRWVANYAALAVGEAGALFNSWGLLEVAVNCASAQAMLHAQVGDCVVVVFNEKPAGGNHE